MPTVKVQLENGQFTEFEYSPGCITHQLSATLCRRLYGEAYEAYTQFGEIAVWEVCQQSVVRRTRSFEHVHDIVSTWPPQSSCYLRLQQSPEVLKCDPQKTRLMNLNAMYSLLDQDWAPCVIDIYDKQFHLRSASDRHRDYNGLWRSLDLQEVDVYDSNLPEIVIFRSQVAHEQLPDRVDRMIVIRTSPDQAQALRTLVYTIRTQRLMTPYSYTFNSPTIGPPPSVLAPGPPNQRGILTPPPLQIPARSPFHAYTAATTEAARSSSSAAASAPAHTQEHTPQVRTPASATAPVHPAPAQVPTKPHGPAQGSFPSPRLHSSELISQPQMLTPPSSPPSSTYSQEAIPLTPPPVPPKDQPRRKSKKRVARRHCPVIEGEVGHSKAW